MTRHAIITDIHFGVRNDAPIFLDASRKFFEEVFFPQIKKMGIESVINLGDTFDKQKQTSTKTLELAETCFFEPLRDFDSLFLVGNHDCPFRNTNHPNAVNLFTQGKYGNIRLVEDPEDVAHAGTGFAVLPWLNRENALQGDRVLQKSKNEFLLGHLEIAGFQMLRGVECKDGLQQSELKRFKRAMSGHFHWRSSNDNIDYLGNPHGTTWADHGNAKGFHVLDTSTNDLQFHKNPHELFRMFDYVEGDDFVEESLAGKFVIVNEVGKVDQPKFERWLESVRDNNPHSLNIRRSSVLEEDRKKKGEEKKIQTISEQMDEYVSEYSTLDEDKTQRLKDFLANLHREAENA